MSATNFHLRLKAWLLCGLLASCAAPADDSAAGQSASSASSQASTSSQAAAGASDPAASAAAATAAFPVTVKDLRGEQVFQQAPQRIVALEFGPMDALARLGVRPIGIAADGDKANEILPHLRPYYPPGSTELVGNRHSPSLEAIAALKPDLIVADEQDHEQIYSQLSRIAPTLLYRSYRGSYADQVAQFRDLSRLTGHAQEGEQALAEHQALFDEVKATVSPSAGRVVVGVLAPTGFFVHSRLSYLGSILTELGLDNPVETQEGETQYLLSPEGLAALQPDTLIVLYNPEDQAAYEKFRAEPLLASLPAVEAGRVYVFNRDAWAKGRGIIGLRGILNDMKTSGVLSGAAAPAKQSVAPAPVQASTP